MNIGSRIQSIIDNHIPFKKSKLRLCRNCVRWYSTRADQCDIPNPAKDDFRGKYDKFFLAVHGKESNYREDPVKEMKRTYLKAHLQYYYEDNISSSVYGHPSLLNVNHECPFYKEAPLRILTGIWRTLEERSPY